MKRFLSAVLLLAPLVAGAQVVSTTPPVDQPPTPQPQAVPPPPPATPPPSTTAPREPLPQDDTYGEPADQPPTTQYLPPDSEELPPPATAVAPPPASGQWVYTGQYGWVFMPYGAGYTYLPASAYPDMYVYYPAYGWRWVVAPWVWGIGPRPYFGVYGGTRFGWYGHGYGRWYGYRGGPVWAARGWGRPGWYGSPAHRVYPGAVVRSAPHVVAPRPGVVVTRPGGFARPGPVARPAAPRAGGVGHAVGHARR